MRHELMGPLAVILREHRVPGLSDRAYGFFAPKILPLVESGADAATIALRLESFEGEIIGRPTMDEHRLMVARKLQEAAGREHR